MGAPSDQDLIQAATEVRGRAHAPYSGFSVGAALRDTEGNVFSGVNVENASLGLSVCAERNAVFAAVAAGSRNFEAVAIVTDGDPPAPPCGACRQVLMEFSPDLRVLLASPRGLDREFRLGQLLPEAFVDYRPGDAT